MRSLDAATAQYFASQTAIRAHVLIWITARDRQTDAPARFGFWTGDDHADFVIGGQSRLYFGAGDVLSLPRLIHEAGLGVRMHSIGLSAIAPEVAEALRGHEPRLAPVEIHRALFSAETGALVATPHRLLRGWIDEARILTPAPGETGSAEITIASAARGLTRVLPLGKSDAQQMRRSGDRFRRWIDLSGAVDVVWGARRGKVSPAQTPHFGTNRDR